MQSYTPAIGNETVFGEPASSMLFIRHQPIQIAGDFDRIRTCRRRGRDVTFSCLDFSHERTEFAEAVADDARLRGSVALPVTPDENVIDRKRH